MSVYSKIVEKDIPIESALYKSAVDLFFVHSNAFVYRADPVTVIRQLVKETIVEEAYDEEPLVPDL